MISKVVQYVNLVLKYLLFILMIVLIISVFAQVLFRFVLEQPLAWTEELARYILVWITFLGAAFAMSLRAHIGVEFFVQKLSPKAYRFAPILSATFCIAFFLILIVQGYSMMEKSMTQLSPVLKIPMGIVYSVIPISGMLLTMNLLHETFRMVFRKGGINS